MIDDTQSAFIPERCIASNILLALELMKGYNRKGSKPNCTIKVDLQRAYDSLEWRFLKKVLICRGFPEVFVNWVMTCVTTSRFSVQVNGTPVGYFKGTKGLRQGDHLSPLLFVICMDCLQAILKQEVERDKEFRFHAKCKKSKVLLLTFANDLLLFIHSHPNSLEVLKRGLQRFFCMSGMEANMDKSQFYLSKDAWGMEESCGEVMGFKLGTLPFRYLGVPLISSRLSIKDCRPLLEMLDTKMSLWNARSLSYAGRLQLIRAVLSSMQAYWSSIFILPKQITESIDMKVRRFLWFKNSGRGCHRASRGKVCKATSAGGLGIIPTAAMNKTLQTKLLWEVIQNSSRKSLWVQWLHVNRLNKQDIWSVKPSSSLPWSWNKLLKLREMIIPYVIYFCDHSVAWSLDSSGRFSNASARTLYLADNSTPGWTCLLQNHIAAPRQVFTLWLALNGGLFSYRRFSLGMIERCLLCLEDGTEDCIEHMLFECIYNKACVRNMMVRCGWIWPLSSWMQATQEAAQMWRRRTRNNSFSKMILAGVVHALWQERNERLWGSGKQTNVERLSIGLCRGFRESIEAMHDKGTWWIAWEGYKSRVFLGE